MLDDEPPPANATRDVPDETVTRVLWNDVTGAHLEELLYGLLDAMGSSSLTWRAGSVTGVTAADGGRDLEAVFDRPSPDGELDRQRWWVECKGRTETVERSAVQQAALDASARVDVDILVIATNSRFSNPTRDWVAERARSFLRQIIKLWDRDNLDRLVRQYPTVVARVLPSALSDGDRLRLLKARFEELGEEPTLLDLEFFWERRSWLMEQESGLLSRAVIMFLYAEGVSLPRRRLWWRLIQEENAGNALIETLLRALPRLLDDESIPRPREMIRVLASVGRVLIACLLLLPDPMALELTLNPWRSIGRGDIADDKKMLEAWRKEILCPVLAFVQSDLIEACSSDCKRVMTSGNPHELGSLRCSQFWDMLVPKGDSAPTDECVIIEEFNQPCTVGLDVTLGCPLAISNQLNIELIVRDVQAVLRFRQTNPDGVARNVSTDSRGPIQLTILENWGMSGRTTRSDT